MKKMTKRNMVTRTLLVVLVIFTLMLQPITQVQAATTIDLFDLTKDTYSVYNNQKLILSSGNVTLIVDEKSYDLTSSKKIVAKSAWFANDGMIYIMSSNDELWFCNYKLNFMEPMLYEKKVESVTTAGSDSDIRITGYTTYNGKQPLITVEELKFLLEMTSGQSNTQKEEVYTFGDEKLIITDGKVILKVNTEEYDLTKDIYAEKALFATDGIIYVFSNNVLYLCSYEMQGTNIHLMVYERDIVKISTSGSGETTRITGYDNAKGPQPLLTIEEWKYLLNMTPETSENTKTGQDKDLSTNVETKNIETSEDKDLSTNVETKNIETSKAKDLSTNVETIKIETSQIKNSPNSEIIEIMANTKKTSYSSKKKGNYIYLFNGNSKIGKAKLKGNKLKFKNKTIKKVAAALFNSKGNLVVITQKGKLQVINQKSGKVKTIQKSGVKGYLYNTKNLITKYKFAGKYKNASKL